MTITMMPIAELVFDAEVWPRVHRDEERVGQLAEIVTAGGTLPPIKVDRSTRLVLGGWHTVAAYQRVRRDPVPVTLVDVPAPERLLYAYREDAEAALPYSAADVRSVARRLFLARSNGHGVNVAALARDLGRTQQTVSVWVADLVTAEAERVAIAHSARVIIAHALTEGASCSQRRTAALLGVSEGTVRTDTKVGSATHLTDERAVSAAHVLLLQTAERGSTDEERQAAADWLLGQRDPLALRCARRVRVLDEAIRWLDTVLEPLNALELLNVLRDHIDASDEVILEKEGELRALIARLTAGIARIERTLQDEST